MFPLSSTLSYHLWTQSCQPNPWFSILTLNLLTLSFHRKFTVNITGDTSPVQQCSRKAIFTTCRNVNLLSLKKDAVATEETKCCKLRSVLLSIPKDGHVMQPGASIRPRWTRTLTPTTTLTLPYQITLEHGRWIAIDQFKYPPLQAIITFKVRITLYGKAVDQKLIRLHYTICLIHEWSITALGPKTIRAHSRIKHIARVITNNYQ